MGTPMPETHQTREHSRVGLEPRGLAAIRARAGHLYPQTVRGTLLSVVLVVVVPTVLAQIWTYSGRFEEQRAEQFASNLELGRSVAATFETYVQDVLHQELAVGIALTMENPLSPEQVRRIVAENAREFPGIRDLAWVDPQGQILASMSPRVVGLDVSHRPFFQSIVEGQGWKVSDLLRSLTGDQPVFAIARGMRDEGGRLLGVVVAVMDPREVAASVLATGRLGQGAIALIDSTGRFVCRRPEADLTWEKRDLLKGFPILEPALAGREMTGSFVSLVDGEERIVAVVPVRSIGWVVSANRPVSEVMRAVVQDLVRDAALMLSVVAAGACCALLLSRRLTSPLNRLATHALAIGRGELGQRIQVAGPVELQQLAEACNHMLGEIGVREKRLQRQSSIAETLVRAAERLSANLDPRAVLEVLCEETSRALGGVAVRIDLYDEERDAFVSGAGVGLPLEGGEDWLPVPRSIYEERGWQMGSLVVLGAGDIPGLPNANLYRRWSVQTVVRVAMVRDGQIVGELRVFALGEERRFTEDELAMMRGLAGLASQAIANARLYEDVCAARERLRALSRRLVGLLEADRRHIARELHDEIGQELTGLGLTLESAARLSTDPSLLASLALARDVAGDLLSRVHDLSLDLRPAILDDLGLVPALLWHFDRYTAQTSLRVDFRHGLEEGRRFEPEVETAVYRIVQEALTNAARHSGAKEVVVRLWAGTDLLGVRVEDRGTGFDPRAIRAVGSPGGLAGMRERASLLGGRLIVESSPATGTKVIAELPVGRAEGIEEV